MNRLFFGILLMVLTAASAGAQDASIEDATGALQSVLSNLKDSVNKLAVDNNQLEARDNLMRHDVLQLQMQLGKLQSQGDQLNQSMDKLQEKNPHRDAQITEMEQENYTLDNSTQQAETSIKTIQQSMDAAYHEHEALLLRLKTLSAGVIAASAPIPVPAQIQSPEAQAAQRLQKEKLKLLKMIDESQQRQAALHQSMLDVQQNTPIQPGAEALAHQELLKEQIKGLEAEIAALPPEKNMPVITIVADDNQIRDLESELRAMENNYNQMKDLMNQMTQKAQTEHMTPGENAEARKLQNNIDDLNRQSRGLRADLDDLRSQMVDLDKRKSYLDDMVRKLP